MVRGRANETFPAATEYGAIYWWCGNRDRSKRGLVLIRAIHLRKYFGVSPAGTLHVGAHLGEEARDYDAARFDPVVWVEAQKHLIPGLVEATQAQGGRVIQAAVWSESGKKIVLNIANNSQSTSLFDFAEHLNEYPEVGFVRQEVVTTSRLDEILLPGERIELVCLDLQGAELEALKGLGERLADVEWIYSEVNGVALYENIPLVQDLDEYLDAHGFSRVVTVWTTHGWGEALYVRAGRDVRRLRRLGGLYSILHRAKVWGAVRSARRRVKHGIDRVYLVCKVVLGKLTGLRPE